MLYGYVHIFTLQKYKKNIKYTNFLVFFSVFYEKVVTLQTISKIYTHET